MGPKIQAAIDFVQKSSNPNAWAAIGDLRDAAKIMSNEEGTIIKDDPNLHATGVVWRSSSAAGGEESSSTKKESKEQHKSG